MMPPLSGDRTTSNELGVWDLAIQPCRGSQDRAGNSLRGGLGESVNSVAAVPDEVGIAATEGDRPIEVGDGPGEVAPGEVEAPATDPGLGVVRVEPERRVQVSHGTVEVAKPSMGLGSGAI
jgi:hypothetical protein